MEGLTVDDTNGLLAYSIDAFRCLLGTFQLGNDIFTLLRTHRIGRCPDFLHVRHKRQLLQFLCLQRVFHADHDRIVPLARAHNPRTCGSNLLHIFRRYGQVALGHRDMLTLTAVDGTLGEKFLWLLHTERSAFLIRQG